MVVEVVQWFSVELSNQSLKILLKNMNLEAEIGERRRLTLEEYEELHENKLISRRILMLHSKKNLF